MSATPRTDAEVNGKPCTRFAVMVGDSLRDALVPSEFARTLERELEDARAVALKHEMEADSLRQQLRALRLVCGTTDGNKFETTVDRLVMYNNALRADKARLDWLEAQGHPQMGWMARASATGRGYRLHQDPFAPANSPRSAIDAAMAAEKKEGQP